MSDCMKLVASRGREPNSILIGDWHIEDPQYIWLDVSWEPSEEDWNHKFGKRISYRGGEHGFPILSSSFMAEGSVVYAKFSTLLGETPAMIHDLQERRFRFEIPSQTTNIGPKLNEERKSWWRRRFGARTRDQVIDKAVYAEVDRNFVAFYFKHYGSWQSDICTFLVSQKPLADWVQHLDQAARKRHIKKELLAKIDLLMSNAWEHGFDLLSINRSYEQLLEMAKEACVKLGWKLEVTTT